MSNAWVLGKLWCTVALCKKLLPSRCLWLILIHTVCLSSLKEEETEALSEDGSKEAHDKSVRCMPSYKMYNFNQIHSKYNRSWHSRVSNGVCCKTLGLRGGQLLGSLSALFTTRCARGNIYFTVCKDHMRWNTETRRTPRTCAVTDSSHLFPLYISFSREGTLKRQSICLTMQNMSLCT